LYTDYLDYWLNIDFPNEGTRVVGNLINILGIDMHKAGELYAQVAIEVYKKRYQLAVRDRRLSDEDDKKLEKLWKDLHLPENKYKDISEENKRNEIKSYIETITADGEISPEEDQELIDSMSSLKVTLPWDENSKQAYIKMQRVWQLNHGELPRLSTDIILPKNEICHYVQNVDWYEQRVVRGNINYAGPTYRLKIAKGFYYRVGSIKYAQQSKEQLQKIDSGKVYITNKRVLFVGIKKNTTIQYSKIINVHPYKNGVEIIKDSGKNPFLSFEYNIDEFTALLTRLIANS
jgi:hypothetical protein